MKRISAFFIAVIMLLLTACGTAAPEATDSPDGENSAPAGILSSFSTTDIEGNAVDESLFSDYKLTMVNVWATYCGPCISEMPDLGTLAEEYADKGFQIVGLVSDVLDSDGNLDSAQIDKAKEIVASTGANYTHIVPGEGTYGLLSQIYAVPTTLFVDSEGRQVGSAYLSAKSLEAPIIPPISRNCNCRATSSAAARFTSNAFVSWSSPNFTRLPLFTSIT